MVFLVAESNARSRPNMGLGTLTAESPVGAGGQLITIEELLTSGACG